MHRVQFPQAHSALASICHKVIRRLVQYNSVVETVELSRCMSFTCFYVRLSESMTSKGEKYPCGGLQVKAELRSKSHDGAVVPGEVEDHGDGTYTITLMPQTAGPHQLLVTMDGQHVQNSHCDLDVIRHRQYNILCDTARASYPL
eukprot:Em0001g256a